jgi:hypothetical protein
VAQTAVLPPNTKPKPVELIMFAYDENIVNEIDPEKVFLFDPYGVNMASELSVGDSRVEFVDNVNK